MSEPEAGSKLVLRIVHGDCIVRAAVAIGTNCAELKASWQILHRHKEPFARVLKTSEDGDIDAFDIYFL